jgi:hypothetical protein
VMPMMPSPNAPSPFDGLGMDRTFKQDRVDVNYREGQDNYSCGRCVHWIDPGDCQQVEGPVSRAGVCDLFEEREAVDDGYESDG